MFRPFFSRSCRAHTMPPLGVEQLESRDVPTTLVGLTDTNDIYEFDSANPGTITNAVQITGLQTNSEHVVGEAIRPSTGQLYVSTVQTGSTTDSDLRTYTVNVTTGAATFVGATGAVPNLGDRATGYSFDPVSGLIRVIQADDVNDLINPNTGVLESEETSLTYTSPAATPVVAIAYTAGSSQSPATLYAIDEGDNALALVGGLNGSPSPNGGAVTAVGPLGVTLDTNSFSGLAIDPTSGLAVTSLTVGGITDLYDVDLATGGATSAGDIGNGTVPIIGLAFEPPVAASVIVVGSFTGGDVQVLNPQTGAVISQFQPFAGFEGAVKVAVGDLTGNGASDIVVAAVAPQGPIKVFDESTGALLESFYAFPNFNGTVSVAVGDLTGSGHADVIVSASGYAANGAVKAFDGITGDLVTSFLAYPGFDGDVSVAAGDFGGTGKDEIVTVASLNGHVEVFNLDGTIYTNPSLPGFGYSFYTFVGFVGDVSVAAGDLSGNGYADLVIASGPGSRGEVRVYDGNNGLLVGDFFTAPAFNTPGASVAVADVTGTGALDLAITPGPGPTTDVETFEANASPLGITYPAFTDYAGGAYIAATNT
jgi:hypothetical protein